MSNKNLRAYRTTLFFVYYSFLLYCSWTAAYRLWHAQTAMVIDFSSATGRWNAVINSLVTFLVGVVLCWPHTLPRLPRRWVRLFCAMLCMLGCLMAFGFIVQKVSALCPSLNTIRIIGPQKKDYISTFFVCCFIGYSEETFFRRAACKVFWFLPIWGAHVLMSILFGLTHSPQGPFAMVFATLAGLVFAMFYEMATRKYGTTGWYAIALTHGLYDFFNLIIIY